MAGFPAPPFTFRGRGDRIFFPDTTNRGHMTFQWEHTPANRTMGDEKILIGRQQVLLTTEELYHSLSIGKSSHLRRLEQKIHWVPSLTFSQYAVSVFDTP